MSEWLLRKHRGSLKESLKTIQKFSTLYGLISYISINEKCDIRNITISVYDYMLDKRINWDYTYIVCIDNIPYGFFTYKIK